MRHHTHHLPWRTLLVQLSLFAMAFILCSYAPSTPSYPGVEYGGGMHSSDMYATSTYNPYSDIYGSPEIVYGHYGMLGVSGYTGDGSYYEGNIRDKESGIWGGSSFWENDYLYEYYLDDNGDWWRCNSGRWQKWINVMDWHWSEIIYQDEPAVPHHEMFKENPAPLDEDIWVLLFIIMLVVVSGAYMICHKKYIRRSSANSHE